MVKFCNADSGNIYESDYNSCKNEGGQLFGPGNTLCNPRLTVGFLFNDPPSTFTATGMEEIVIKMSKVEIIEIGVQTVTVSMHLKVSWSENRLYFNTEYPGSGGVIYLNKEHQQQIWSPQIVIGNNMVSVKKNREEFGFYKAWNQIYPYKYIGQKSFYLSTTILCEMDFHDFPFDNHVCELEVS